MIWKNKFHERINELWERAKERNNKTTQTEYARRLGVTRNALLGWLRGTGQPDADGFVRIAMVENVSLTWLLGDERPQSRDELLQDEQNMLELYRDISLEHKDDILMLARRFQTRDIGK
jgi:transcriptional regulator with XRE-family HTH domain